jgi:hypothetical protein
VGQRQAAILAGTPLGLRALGRAGVLEARAAAFVTAAQVQVQSDARMLRIKKAVKTGNLCAKAAA